VSFPIHEEEKERQIIQAVPLASYGLTLLYIKYSRALVKLVHIWSCFKKTKTNRLARNRNYELNIKRIIPKATYNVVTLWQLLFLL
jgi:hypothetical protein